TAAAARHRRLRDRPPARPGGSADRQQDAAGDRHRHPRRTDTTTRAGDSPRAGMNGVAEGIGVLMLAAGASRRFGADKRRASLANGRTLLQASLAAVPSSFTLRLLVLRPGDEDLAAHCRAAGWQVLMAPDAARG